MRPRPATREHCSTYRQRRQSRAGRTGADGVRRACRAHSDLQKAFANPAVPVTAKRAIVDKLVRQLKMSGPAAKLLLLLAERDRLALLPDLVAATASG